MIRRDFLKGAAAIAAGAVPLAEARPSQSARDLETVGAYYWVNVSRETIGSIEPWQDESR